MGLWIFAYGSLLWRPDFPFRERHGAAIEGWERRLDQGSPDHRGTPSQLGRVATLVRAPGTICGGAVYGVEEGDVGRVLCQLDHREQGGYARIEVEARLTSDARRVVATSWIATADNPYYLGPTSMLEMLAQIRAAAGPSGANDEYVLCLASALRELGVEDANLTRIADALLRNDELEL